MKDYSEILELLKSKASVKQDVYQNGKEAFASLRESAEQITKELAEAYSETDPRVKIKLEPVTENEFRLVLGGDVLIFHMHSNVFQYDKKNFFWKQSYFKEDETRAYGIMIMVYNFSTDSLSLDRENDLGYLIGRIFVNRDNHFNLESQLSLRSKYPHLNKQVFDVENQKNVLECLIVYSMNFELNVPRYENVQTVTVRQAQDFRNKIKLKTAKKLGFQFGDPNTSEIE